MTQLNSARGEKTTETALQKIEGHNNWSGSNRGTSESFKAMDTVLGHFLLLCIMFKVPEVRLESKHTLQEPFWFPLWRAHVWFQFLQPGGKGTYIRSFGIILESSVSCHMQYPTVSCVNWFETTDQWLKAHSERLHRVTFPQLTSVLLQKCWESTSCNGAIIPDLVKLSFMVIFSNSATKQVRGH